MAKFNLYADEDSIIVSGSTIEEVYRKIQDQLQVAFLNW